MVIIWQDVEQASVIPYNPIVQEAFDFFSSLNFLLAVGIMSGLDAIMRGISSLMAWSETSKFSFLYQVKSYKKRITITKVFLYGASIFPSILSIFYLSNAITVLPISIIQNLTNEKIFMLWGALSFPQILDTLFAYGKSLSDRAENWFKNKIYQKYLENFLQTSEEKKIEIQRQNYLNLLKKLMWILYNLPDKQIKRLYNEIFQKKGNNTIHDSLSTKTLKTLEALLKIYESYERETLIPSMKVLKEQASTFGWMVASLASPARHIVFWYAVYNMKCIENIYRPL